MATLTNAELGRVARQLGHALAVLPNVTGRRFRAECTCGYSSVNRTTERLAIEAARHHQWLVVREARSDGVSLPRSVGGSA